MIRSVLVPVMLGSLCMVARAQTAVEAAASSPQRPVSQGLAPRVGVLGGLYSIDSDRNGRNSGDTYGFQLGARYIADGLIRSGVVFADLSLERTTNRAAISTAFNRTDVLSYFGLTLGGLSPFVGYRGGFQSQSENHSGVFATDLFEDNFFHEHGPLAGVFGQIYRGSRSSLSAFAFYNRTRVSYGVFELGRGDEHQDVYSVTFTFTPMSAPNNQLLLRYQRFDLEARDGEPEYSEDYVHLIYQRRWPFPLKF